MRVLAINACLRLMLARLVVVVQQDPTALQRDQRTSRRINHHQF